ncbi:MAG: PEP-utilizing enzyme [Patescibacteria group bacterium]
MNSYPKFVKAYTRDFSIIMEEAWYYALSKGLWGKLGLSSPVVWPNFFRFNNGIIEVWENKDFIKSIIDAIRTKKNDPSFFNNLLKQYKKLVAELKNDKMPNHLYVSKLFDTISIFSIIWYGILDSRTEKRLKNKFVNVRDTDTIFDTNDKIVRKRILNKFPKFHGYETTLMTDEFLGTPPSGVILKRRLNNFILIPGQFADIIELNQFVKQFRMELELFAKPKNYLIKGSVANSGRATGKVRIIRMKKDVKNMKQGEILISPMTTPDVFQALRKASAVVTDEGGSLCHAAILARELNIPCIINAKVASELYKDGDLVEGLLVK